MSFRARDLVAVRRRERAFTVGGCSICAFEMRTRDWRGRHGPALALLEGLWADGAAMLLAFPDEDDLPAERLADGLFLVVPQEHSATDFCRWTSAGHWRLWSGPERPPRIEWASKVGDEALALAVAVAQRGGWVISSEADSDDWTVVELGGPGPR